MTTITTQNGTELELCTVNQFYITGVRAQAKEDFIEEHGDLLAAPTYDIECGGGPFSSWFETRTHTETTIDDGTKTEKRDWNTYTTQQKELNSLIWMRTSRVYLLRGVKTEPPDNGWQIQQERDKVKIPTDSEDLKIHWLETEAVTYRYELGYLVSAVQAQIQRTEEARQLAVDMFQRAMEFGRWPDA